MRPRLLTNYTLFSFNNVQCYRDCLSFFINERDKRK